MNDKQKQQVRDWRKNIPNTYNGAYRRGFDKAIEGKSLRAAIDAKCMDCMGWQATEVKRCDVVTCPMWTVRPYQTNSGANT